jgi:hypothetical protein
MIPLYRRHGSEDIVKDDMLLSCDPPGRNIQDLGNLTGMDLAKTQKHPTTGSKFPMRQFLALLKFGVQHIYRTSPYVDISETMARHSPASKNIGGADTIFTWCIVIDVGCILHCHRPERGIDTILPVHTCVEDHHTSQVGYCVYGPLNHSILMVGIGALKP